MDIEVNKYFNDLSLYNHLNKNIISIIVGYLTDLPRLPFLEELMINRWPIECIYYDEYVISEGKRFKIRNAKQCYIKIGTCIIVDY